MGGDLKKKEKITDYELEKVSFVHEKIVEFSNNQQKAIEHLNNKVNWIIIIDIALIGYLLNKKHSNCLLVISALFIVGSLLIAIISVWSKKYKLGPKLREVIDKSSQWSYEKLMRNFNDKLEKDITKNEILVSETALLLKISIIFLMMAIVFLFLFILS
jgi:disulfide bond formation protein DsbB